MGIGPCMFSSCVLFRKGRVLPAWRWDFGVSDMRLPGALIERVGVVGAFGWLIIGSVVSKDAECASKLVQGGVRYR